MNIENEINLNAFKDLKMFDGFGKLPPDSPSLKQIHLNASDDISNEKRREIAAAIKEAMPETTLILTIIETQEVLNEDDGQAMSWLVLQSLLASRQFGLCGGSPMPRIEKSISDENRISLDFGDDISNEQRQEVIDIVKAVMPEVTVFLTVFEFQVLDGVVKDKHLIPIIVP